MNYACPNCIHYPDTECCKNVPEGQYCHADSVDIADDPDVSTKNSYQIPNKYIKIIHFNFLGQEWL